MHSTHIRYLFSIVCVRGPELVVGYEGPTCALGHAFHSVGENGGVGRPVLDPILVSLVVPPGVQLEERSMEDQWNTLHALAEGISVLP